MDERNGDCFDHHEDLFAPLSASDSEHDCLKDFLLEPSRPIAVPPNLPSPVVQQPIQELYPWNNGQIHQYQNICRPEVNSLLELPPVNHNDPVITGNLLDTGDVSDKNGGECWSPAADFAACPSERTVSSDCVSSETVCSPSEGTSDSPSPSKVHQVASGEQPPRKRPSSSRKRKGTSRPRATIATYQSQIAPDQNGIKIRIKKSLAPVPPRSRRRKPKEEVLDSYQEPAEQSGWGENLPKEILYGIFEMVTSTEGSVPFLARVSRVCRLWREVAISPRLWHHVDLSGTWVKDRAKNDLKFRWLCENRLALVHDLNIGGWEFDGIPGILDKMASSCGELRSLSLTGWQGLSAENVKFLIANCPKLQRLDLSSINPEMNNPRSAVSMMSLVNLAQEMGERVTQLVLARNKLSGIPQIISALSTYCPNLQVLDLSNVKTVSHTTAYLHVEKLQQGCPKLRVLRMTNSELALSTVSLKEQGLSEGFPHLEELSVAGVLENMSSKPVIDDDSLQRILKSSHKLRLLDVRACSRVTDSSLVRVPAWDLEHLFLSGCYVTRVNDSGLELICQKWAHSLIEVDLGWSTATQSLDAAVNALAHHIEKSPLRALNLCGSSVSLDPVKAVLTQCPLLTSLNLSSCRALPRGMKRLYQGAELTELRMTILKGDSNTE
ncbi:hypothetical protein AAG570_011339 [Ranatra chinensis]|uniref:F-box domain-containing protein n=1 Tax=Ranatra chinensis TaxID=642074 RepID=A0ABD0YKB9_9HEMI